ncbi:hypothetical protein SEUCBS139899_003016 [Sporothrix eucalyptigena]
MTVPSTTTPPDAATGRAVDLVARATPTVATVSGWDYIGCYTDVQYVTGTRLLNANSTTMVAVQHPSYCCEWCANQETPLSYCGIETGSVCYCDSTTQLVTADVSAPAYDCAMPCVGNHDVQCGGAGYANVYSAAVNLSRETAADDRTVASVPGYTYLGCYSDSSARLLKQATITGPYMMDPAYCCAMCLNADNGNVVCGVEAYLWCFCDYDTVLPNALAASASQCDSECAGHPDQLCGGSFRLNMYKVTAVTTSSASSSGPATNIDAGSTTSTVPQSTDTQSASSGHGLHGGAIAGVVIGALVGVALLAGLAYFAVARGRMWRAKKDGSSRSLPPEVLGDTKHGGPGPYQLDAPVASEPAEPRPPTPIYELQGYQSVPQEPRHD